MLHRAEEVTENATLQAVRGITSGLPVIRPQSAASTDAGLKVTTQPGTRATLFCGCRLIAVGPAPKPQALGIVTHEIDT
jgi:hypothetical protein